MSTYIHHSHFKLLRKADQVERNILVQLVDSIISWALAVLLIGSISGCCYLFYLLLMKELMLIQ